MGDIQYSIHTSSLLKAGLMKCLNYQHAQIVFGMLGIVTALFLTVLLYLYIWLSAYLSHQLQGLISLRFIKHFDLGGMGNSEVLLVLSCTLTDSLEIVLCQHTSKTTLIRFSSFRKFG